MGLSDVHAHLTHPRLRQQLPEILQRAAAAGITSIISNGLNPADNQEVLELSRQHPIIRPALGLYPVDAVLTEMIAAGVDYPRDEGPVFTGAQGVAFVRDHIDSAIAVGEIGLDGYWVPESFWEQQDAVFRQLVQLALQADKPIIIHTRKRERRTFELLQELGAKRVNWHCFGGKLKLAREIATHGHYFSIPANARRSESFTRMLQTLPREQLLLETDCPYLAPSPGATSEPADVAQTAAYAAELWGCSEREVAQRCEENFGRLFRA